MKHPILVTTFRNTILAAIYVFVVAQIMTNGNTWFGNAGGVIGPFVVLMLFCLSTAVVGGLVFGESILLFMKGKQKDSIKAALYSIGWLGVYTVVGLFILAVTN